MAVDLVGAAIERPDGHDCTREAVRTGPAQRVIGYSGRRREIEGLRGQSDADRLFRHEATIGLEGLLVEVQSLDAQVSRVLGTEAAHVVGVVQADGLRTDRGAEG